ncbi:hypothetical protein ACFLSZ_05925 [Candidatus Bipolaricaulota bacterium]
MSRGERVTLLVGSPKGLEAGSSVRLGRTITDVLEEAGWHCGAFHLHAAVRTEGLMSELLDSIDSTDVVVLSTPLYVDSLPAPVIRALHRIAAHRNGTDGGNIPRFLSIVNCGFVEPWQNDGAQRMLEQFCAEARFESVGALSLGAGGAMTGKVQKAFKLAAEALRGDILIPVDVRKLTRSRIIPAWLYILGGNMMWKKQAKANGVRNQLKAQPYKRAQSSCT